MIRFSRRDIEQIAQRVIAAYRTLPEVKNTTIRKIDPELLVTKVLRLHLEYAHLSLDGYTLGMTCFHEMDVEIFDEDDTSMFYTMDGNTILVERDLRNDCSCIGRCNFTIMHEGAHQIFKILYPAAYGTPKKSDKPIHFYRPQTTPHPKITDWEEWQANTLASALMMPEEIVKQGMFLFGLGEKIEVLNAKYFRETFLKFRYLAEYLGVSQQALAIRLKQLYLLDKEYLDHPDAMIDIYNY